MSPSQGDIWWAEAEDRVRPVLVVTRDEALLALRRIMVAPITRTVRGIPTEVPLDAEDGMREQCAASFDNLRVIPKSSLTSRIGTARQRRHEICAALNAVADC
ncbi:type II toxin-antitoxin system PemK/MazF family toxin [Candidatus Poriferisodalis sp.]|uniref:type II toxin-antitoxin system PemK/MazF family toxin n=1 Tax=Candidatus Poriferisodalis sp. TaxID=3101277 RepID=UPI003B013068